ncbi:hypothetical protein [Streptomyces sp. NPDC060035]|uniref:hypothetical protein n=1 Tax=Streptomyces sp. NPDC060035 TaxID=3347044 RepID=UPI0036B12F24
MNNVHELLERAAEGAGRPDVSVSTEAVYARAARVRFRRRATVAAAALTVLAAGAVTLPGFTDGTRTEQSSVASAPVGQTGRTGKAERLAALFPAGVGDIEQVSLAVLLKQETPAQARTEYVGPLDGQYAVRRDGGVGYLALLFMDRVRVAKKFSGSPMTDLCATRGQEPPRDDCLREELPDGSVLTIWSDSMDYGDGGTPRWGPEFAGRLELKDGSLLAVRSSPGYTGDHSQGPLLKSPPLSREQVRTLLLSPEVLPKK